jgi:hypothetical protein
LNGTPVKSQLLKEFERKGLFTDDEGLKDMLQGVMRLREAGREKAQPKETQKSR